MKIGTIGTGFITSWFIQSLLEVGQTFTNVSCTAVYSRSESKAKKLAEQFHVGKIYTDIMLMMEDDEIDTIYVASPNSLHFYHAELALKHHKNVILEKPFVSNSKECEHLIQLAKKAHLFLFEAITTRYLPNVLYIKEQLSSLGKIHIIECNMSQRSRKYDELLAGGKPNVFNTAFSGGALMDINLYNIQFVYELFGMPLTVTYEANLYDGIDTSGVLLLGYDGFKASCIGSKDCNAKNFIQIQGDNGYMYIESAACTVREVSICLNHCEETKCSFQDKELTHYYYLKRFIQIMAEQNYDACYFELEKTLAVMKILDKAKYSAGIQFYNDER